MHLNIQTTLTPRVEIVHRLVSIVRWKHEVIWNIPYQISMWLWSGFVVLHGTVCMNTWSVFDRNVDQRNVNAAIN